MEELFLWKFYWNMRRSGSVQGLFVATEKTVEELIGEYIYFGEILGKHSEVYGHIDEGDITKVDLDSETVRKVAVVLGKTWSGYNPLNYIRYYCSICEDRYDQDEFYDLDRLICGSCQYDIEHPNEENE